MTDLLCPVCLDGLESSNANTTPCGHLFCEPCIRAHLRISATCPICRRDALRVKDLVRVYLSACPQDPPPTETRAPAIDLARLENVYDAQPRRKRKAVDLAHVENELDQPRRKRMQTDLAYVLAMENERSVDRRRRKITVIDLTLSEDTHSRRQCTREVIDLTGED